MHIEAGSHACRVVALLLLLKADANMPILAAQASSLLAHFADTPCFLFIANFQGKIG
jgi:hypothetical protein